MPSQASASASAADSAMPLHSPVTSRCAVAGGPTIRVKTSRMPTICALSDTASATMARKAVETKRSGTPLASASSGCRLAKISGRMIAASASERYDAKPDQRRDHGSVDREHIAEQQRRRLGGECRVVVQEQQSESQRQRQHDADSDVAAADALAEHSHADRRPQR